MSLKYILLAPFFFTLTMLSIAAAFVQSLGRSTLLKISVLLVVIAAAVTIPLVVADQSSGSGAPVPLTYYEKYSSYR